METIDFGILSILPPVLSIMLALTTKEVISSLFIGIVSGATIYAFRTQSGILSIFKITFTSMVQAVSQNIFILIFIAILGALIYVVTMSGGTYAYGKWAAKKIKSRKVVQLAIALFSIMMSIDDYFDCLTVGTVMKPITDKHRISRAKFSYIIDSMAAPVCILTPMSSWAASVTSCIDSYEQGGMVIFIKTIPYNLYAILSILLVVILSLTNLDFGPMAIFEHNAIKTGDVFTTSFRPENEQLSKDNVSDKGRIIDLVLPICTLVIMLPIMMLETGGFFKGSKLVQALSNSNSGLSITVSALCALMVAMVMFIPRKIMNFKKFMGGVSKGIESMTSSFVILTMAWTMSEVCQKLLHTGEYVGNLVGTSQLQNYLIPATMFVVSGFLSFAIGTSWGTFSILIPIVMSVCSKVAPDMMIISIAATLSGSVYGDNCSPISDTTILSSTGAGCNHIDHVTTQMPYAILTAFISFVGYLTLGMTKNLILTFLISVALIIILLLFFKRIRSSKSYLNNENFATKESNVK